MLTKDENIVNVEVAVQYKRSNPVFFLLEASAPEDSLAQASEAELRHVVGSTTMDSTLTVGREQIAMDVKSRFCLLYTSPSPRDDVISRMPSSA